MSWEPRSEPSKRIGTMVMKKCEVRSVAELVMIAERTGIMPTDGIAAMRCAPRLSRCARLADDSPPCRGPLIAPLWTMSGPGKAI